MRKIVSTVFWVSVACLCLTGCNPGAGAGTEASSSAPAAAPPAQPAAVPAAAPAATQPAAAVAAQPAAAAVPAQPTPPTPTGDALVDKLNTKKFEVAPLFVPTSQLLKQSLEKGKPQPYQVQLPGPPFCHTYLAVTDDKAENIDITLESPAGIQESADGTQESTAVVANHCPQTAGAYKLTVAIPKGAGEFAVQVFSK